MIHLFGRSETRLDSDPFVARVTKIPHKPFPIMEQEALLWDSSEKMPVGFKSYLIATESNKSACPPNTIKLPENLRHLSEGDIVQVVPQTGQIAVLFRKASTSNTILFTEKCNNNCLICSQPPVQASECSLQIWEQAIPLIDEQTQEIGISGGEPTCYPDPLLKLIRLCRNYLPFTSLHILSNGRFFSYLTFCKELAELAHSNLMVGIALNSDISHEHNFIVQAEGAYDQTIRGLMNLARVGVAIELRVVIHKVNADRLTSISSFISRNLPFCRHVAFMGLEPIGLARKNLSSLWVDPYEYKDSLSSAVEIISTARMNVSIYNHALCVLNKEAWPYARKSISDWKCEFLEQCDGCAVKTDCGGFFSSALSCHSSHIKAVSA